MPDKNTERTRGKGKGNDAMSRRKWLIGVGKAAALAGIAGKTGPLEAGQPAGPAAPENKQEMLPPGLYNPSSGHLGSALMEESRFHPIPPACPVDFIRPREGPFKPQFFSPDEYRIIHRLTALILGEGPAVSGNESKVQEANIVDEVAEWIDLRSQSLAGIREATQRLTPEQVALAEAYDGAPVLHHIRSTDPQKAYRDGLAWIAEESKRRYQREFIALTERQQTAILDLISDDRASKGSENNGTRFFRLLKSDVISGFYTSQRGLKELNYKGNRFYAESPGCPSSRHLPVIPRH